MEGPWGNFAKFSPMLAVNKPNRLLPPKALLGMLAGMVQLQASSHIQTHLLVAAIG
jgi:hypothetical protein